MSLQDPDLNPNLEDVQGRTLLYLATGKGDIELMAALLRDHGADANIPNKVFNTPLMHAVADANEEAAMFLVNNVPNITVTGRHYLLPAECPEGAQLLANFY